uniref:Uncharacterized protein n=1 Tax=Sipha flava TaxID=143950 RepID=A0A2S2Q077_9HEMI
MALTAKQGSKLSKRIKPLNKKVIIILEEHCINYYQNYLITILSANNNLWLTTNVLFNLSFNTISPFKHENNIFDTEKEKCELFAESFKNISTSNTDDTETNLMVNCTHSEPDYSFQKMLPYTTSI